MPKALLCPPIRTMGWQAPPEHVPPRQLWPQVPQLFASVLVGTQALLQHVLGAEQVPQSSKLPQPSATWPHVAPTAAQVFGTHAHWWAALQAIWLPVQSALVLHWTQVPAPSQTLPPLSVHEVPVTAAVE